MDPKLDAVALWETLTEMAIDDALDEIRRMTDEDLRELRKSQRYFEAPSSILWRNRHWHERTRNALRDVTTRGSNRR